MVSTCTPVLATQLTQRTFHRRDIISLQPNILWRIERGVVRTLTWSESGTTVVLGYWGSGDVVGQALSKVQPYQIECVTSVAASSVPLENCDTVLEEIFCHTQQTEELLTIVRQESVYLRLLQLLIWLAQKFGHSVEQGQSLALQLTHQDMAEMIGTTRVTVTRLLAQFEQSGIIHRCQRQIILLR
ncbi:MAG: Regulatory protein CysR [Chroococcidiopsis sp. SAG 2025]|uniref:Crp/Fnr family transcriptional regulator n=1 Tax=Chroococcidiopsis sp. SAG 2025 TaxID=171389 RepID=UPI0029370760|nr:Crp/Fnr family transcriptional regulator [Chroococcidiopsis sp. SAG 2025]MDV2994800.1 Regulatory protein CysR [Chroococcidiopsis sp. SAG 2025]